MQHRQHDLGGGSTALVHVDGNAASVVHDGDRVVDVDGDVHLVAEAGQRLVDRVVDDLVDEVMKARLSGRPDVHGGPLADGLETFEDLDFVGTVFVRRKAVVAVSGTASGRALAFESVCGSSCDTKTSLVQ